MSQASFTLPDEAVSSGYLTIQGVLQALQSASSGATEPADKVAYMFWADTTTGTLKQRNAANDGWIIRATLGVAGILDKTADYTVTVADHGKVINVDSTGGAVDITLPAAATAGNGFHVTVKAAEVSNTITVDADGSETIDGATTRTLDALYQTETYVSDGSEWYVVRSYIPAGTAAHNLVVLTSDGKLPALSGENLTNVPGGAWEHISTQNITTPVSTVSFTSGIDGTYDVYALVWTDLSNNSSGNGSISCKFSTNGGSSYATTNYQGHVNLLTSSSASYSGVTWSAYGYMLIGYFGGHVSDTKLEGSSGVMYFSTPSDATRETKVWGIHSGYDAANVTSGGTFAGSYDTAAAVNALQIGGGSFVAGGKVSLYGMKRS